jgi:hypothetical protein
VVLGPASTLISAAPCLKLQRILGRDILNADECRTCLDCDGERSMVSVCVCVCACVYTLQLADLYLSNHVRYVCIQSLLAVEKTRIHKKMKDAAKSWWRIRMAIRR